MNPVAVVLDTSAVLAYVDGQVAAGELLAMVAEEGAWSACRRRAWSLPEQPSLKTSPFSNFPG